MSLNNVSVVAGVARENLGMLVFGLVLSIVLMAVRAILISKLLNRHRRVGNVGLAVAVWIAGNPAWDGGRKLIRYFSA